MASKPYSSAEVGPLIWKPALETEPDVVSNLLTAAGELREYLRAAMLRPRASPAKVAMGIAVLDIWRLITDDMERLHGEVDSASTAAVASLGVATSGHVSDADGLGAIVRACRQRIEASMDPGSQWERVWQRAEEIGRDIGFLLEIEAVRAERLWTALIAFAAPDSRIHLRAASPKALASLLVIESKIQATGVDMLEAIKFELTTAESVVEVNYSKAKREQAHAQEAYNMGPDGARLVQVWFGTNREPKSRQQPDSAYTNRLAIGELFYGVCQVNIPKVEDPVGGLTPYLSAWLRLGDRRGRPRVNNYFRFNNAGEFLNALGNETAKAPSERTGLVFLHGFATSFTAAATTAARISLNIKHQGPTAMFTWASKGRMDAYRHDEDIVDRSREELIKFLTTLTVHAGLEHVDVVVHSLGNRLFLRSLIDWFKRAAPDTIPLRNIYLGAPDVDQQEFQKHASLYALAGAKTTLYGSNSDTALLASKILHQGTSRAGMMPPNKTYSNIDTIETSRIDPSRLRHAYIVDAPAIRADIFNIQNGILHPSKRANINSAGSHFVPDYWRLS